MQLSPERRSELSRELARLTPEGEESEEVKAERRERLARAKERLPKREKGAKPAGPKAIDGDTVRVEEGPDIRLSGMDTPETAKYGKKSDPYADLATDVTQEALESGSLEIGSGEGGYGRRIGTLTREDGEAHSEFMIRNRLGSPTKWSSPKEHAQVVAGYARRHLPEHAAAMDTEADRDVQRRYEEAPDEFEYDPGAKSADGRERRGVAMGALSRGVDNMQGGLYGFAHAIGDQLGDEGVKAWAEDGMKRNAMEASVFRPEVGSFTEIKTGEDVLNYGIEAVFENLPNMGLTIAAGTATVATGGLAGAGIAAAGRAAVMSASKRFAAGAFGASYAMGVGEIQREFREAGIDASGTALVGGIPMAALDAVGMTSMLAPIFKTAKKETIDSIIEASGKKLFEESLKRLPKAAARGFAVEAPTEALQEMTILLARAYEDPEFELLSEKNLVRMTDAFLKGGLAGGITTASIDTAVETLDQASKSQMAKDAGIEPTMSPTQARGKLRELQARRQAERIEAEEAVESLRQNRIDPGPTPGPITDPDPGPTPGPTSDPDGAGEARPTTQSKRPHNDGVLPPPGQATRPRQLTDVDTTATNTATPDQSSTPKVAAEAAGEVDVGQPGKTLPSTPNVQPEDSSTSDAQQAPPTLPTPPTGKSRRAQASITPPKADSSPKPTTQTPSAATGQAAADVRPGRIEPNDVIPATGKAYRTQAAAKSQRTKNGRVETHDVVEVNEGWVERPKPAKTPSAQMPSAQTPSAQSLGEVQRHLKAIDNTYKSPEVATKLKRSVIDSAKISEKTKGELRKSLDAKPPATESSDAKPPAKDWRAIAKEKGAEAREAAFETVDANPSLKREIEAKVRDGQRRKVNDDTIRANLSSLLDQHKIPPAVAGAIVDRAKQEIAAQPAKPLLPKVNEKHWAKDQAKSDRATQFIGHGAPKSSTRGYQEAWGDRANTGQYTAEDWVFVSVNGGTDARAQASLDQSRPALDAAVAAGATLITDRAGTADGQRGSRYNIGEQKLAEYLTEKGYHDPKGIGEWTSKSPSTETAAESDLYGEQVDPESFFGDEPPPLDDSDLAQLDSQREAAEQEAAEQEAAEQGGKKESRAEAAVRKTGLGETKRYFGGNLTLKSGEGTLVLPESISATKATINGVEIPFGPLLNAKANNPSISTDELIARAKQQRVYLTQGRQAMVVDHRGRLRPSEKQVKQYPLLNEHVPNWGMVEVEIDHEEAALPGGTSIKDQYRNAVAVAQRHLAKRNRDEGRTGDDRLVMVARKASHIITAPLGERNQIFERVGLTELDVSEDPGKVARLAATLLRVGGHGFETVDFAEMHEGGQSHTNDDNDGTILIHDGVEGGLAQGTLIIEQETAEGTVELYINKGTFRGRLRFADLLDPDTGEWLTEKASANVDFLLGRKIEGLSQADASKRRTRVEVTQLDGKSGAAFPMQSILGGLMNPAAYINQHTTRVIAKGIEGLASASESLFLAAGLPANFALKTKNLAKKIKQFNLPAVRDYAIGSTLVPEGSVVMLPSTLADYMRAAGLVEPPKIGDTVYLHREPALPTGTGTVAFKYAGTAEFVSENATQDRGIVVNPKDDRLGGMGLDFDGDRLVAIAPHNGFQTRMDAGFEVKNPNLTKLVTKSSNALTDADMRFAPDDPVTSAIFRDAHGWEDRVGEAINQANKYLEVGESTHAVETMAAQVAQAMISSVKKPFDVAQLAQDFGSLKGGIKGIRKGFPEEAQSFFIELLGTVQRAPAAKRRQAIEDMLEELQVKRDSGALTGVQEAIARRIEAVYRVNQQIEMTSGRGMPSYIKERVNAYIDDQIDSKWVDAQAEALQPLAREANQIYRELGEIERASDLQEDTDAGDPNETNPYEEQLLRQLQGIAETVRFFIKSEEVHPAVAMREMPGALWTEIVSARDVKKVLEGLHDERKIRLAPGSATSTEVIPDGEYQVRFDWTQTAPVAEGTDPQLGAWVLTSRDGSQTHVISAAQAERESLHDFLSNASVVRLAVDPDSVSHTKKESAATKITYSGQLTRVSKPSSYVEQGVREGAAGLSEIDPREALSLRPTKGLTGVRKLGKGSAIEQAASMVGKFRRVLGMRKDTPIDIVEDRAVGKLATDYMDLAREMRERSADEQLSPQLRSVYQHDARIAEEIGKALSSIESTGGLEAGHPRLLLNGHFQQSTLRVPTLVVPTARGMSKQEAASAYAHEMGHIFQAYYFDAAPLSTKQAIYDAYIEEMQPNWNSALQGPLERSEAFNEWYAEQVRAYIRDLGASQNHNEVVQGFFAKIVQALRGLYNAVRSQVKTNQTFRQYMDEMLGARHGTKRDTQVAKDQQRLGAYPFMPIRDQGLPNTLNFTPLARTRMRRFMQSVRDSDVTADTMNVAGIIQRNTIQTIGSWGMNQGPNTARIMRQFIRRTDARSEHAPTRLADRHGPFETRVRMEDAKLRQNGFTEAIQPFLRDKRWYDSVLGQTPPVDAKSSLHQEVLPFLIDEVDLSKIPAHLREPVKQVRAVLEQARELAAERYGIHFPERKNYWPVVVDMGRFTRDKAQVIDKLVQGTKMNAQEAEAFWQEMVNGNGTLLDAIDEQTDSEMARILAPGFRAKNHRKWTPQIKEALRDWQVHDVPGTLHQYLRQLAKRGTTEVMFGKRVQTKDGRMVTDPVGKLNDMLRAVREARELSDYDYKYLTGTVIPALFGQLGADTPLAWRNFSAWAVTYQNVNLMGFTLFSSIVDPSVLLGRAGAKSAWDGLRGVIQGQSYEQLIEQLQALGAQRPDMVDHIANDAFGNQFYGSKPAKVNEAFFRMIGMKRWTDFTRAWALSAGKQYLADHLQKAPHSPTSRRKLRALGVTPQQVADWLAADMPVGTDQHQAIDLALNQFIDDSVMRPTAAMRPGWASDPKMMVFAHLKSFAWAFYERAIRQMWTESVAIWGEQQGAAKAMALIPAALLMIPALLLGMAGYEMRRELGWFGEVPEYLEKDGYDYFFELVQRAGLLGPMQFAVDAQGASEMGRNPLIALGGPTVSQLDAWMGIRSMDDLGGQFSRAIPGMNQLPAARQWFNQEVL